MVGTAVGLYLIRDSEVGTREGDRGGAPAERSSSGPRTFENSGVTSYSWPCVLVLVRDWVDATRFGHGGVDPDHMVPRTLYLPDGRAAPVCVVAVSPAEPLPAGPADARLPSSYLGPGFPIVADVQGARHRASVGCLVTDGHRTYALTSRYVAGEPGSVVQAPLRGSLRPIGETAPRQLARLPFSKVLLEFPGRRSYVTLDVADLNELNLGLQLIDQPVEAFGAASGRMRVTIKALFYRHEALAGYDCVSEFLIAPEEGGVQTSPGDSGTVWHLRTSVADAGGVGRIVLRPMAVEWGGQGVAGTTGRRYDFALATGLGTACQLLDVDLVTGHNVGAQPFWGQEGHYSIATVAIDQVRDGRLEAFLRDNVERVSFRPDELDPDTIRRRLSEGDFVELADVPDLVWKKVAADVPGGRDHARNAGPEHPDHYADIDLPGPDGRTLRDLTLSGIANMDPQVWRDWYRANGATEARSQGLLPFRVWQIFDEMVASLRAGDAERFLCAAGIVSHYVGDACQPLHGSFLSDGRKDPADPKARTWSGKGVHATLEDEMVDRHAVELRPMIGPAAKAFGGPIPAIADGRDAAFATVTLMAQSAEILPPGALVDTYVKLGGGASARVVDGLWSAFGRQTADVMGAGARYLAAIWDAAYAVAATPLPDGAGVVSETALAAIHQDGGFVPSLTLDEIGSVLRRAGGEATR
ncbi:hypothetical protein [Lichenibacterium ramalinae]|uniref:hypothetical protein n=1 Tax=Lichenibacterium ramalinae TaxID=2316527 RepID=UPI001A917C6C|nr:hypothetical protein [Lichenibacterium ramalinae]